MFRSIIDWFRVRLGFATNRQIEIEALAMSCESLEEPEFESPKPPILLNLHVGAVAAKASPEFVLTPLINERENLEIVHKTDVVSERKTAEQASMITMTYDNGDTIKFPNSRIQGSSSSFSPTQLLHTLIKQASN